MKSPPPDLFKKRSATNDFLFVSSDEAASENDAEAFEPGSCEYKNAPLAAGFPDMLDRQGLVLNMDTSFKSVAQLCVVVVQIDWAPRHSPAPEADKKNLELSMNDLEPVVGVCRDHGGIWARIGHCRLAFAFPHLAGKDGCGLARQMQAALPSDGTTTLTAGVSVYPTVNDTRTQIIENAEKALEHAGFFGPGSITEFDAVSLNISGDRLYQAGDIRGAVGEFNKGLRLAPSDANLLNSIGVCYGILKKYKSALKAFETAIWLAPDEMMPVYNQGFVFLCQGNTKQALEAFLSADALEPGVFEVVFHIGQIHMDAGTPEKARPYLEAAVQANSHSGSAYRHLGACLDQLGLTKEAIQAYKAVVKINPQDAASLSLLGQLYVKRGESLDVASVLCEQSVRIAPDNGLFRYRLGCVYLKQGRLDIALAEFELAASMGHESRAMIEETQDRMMAAKAS